MKGQNTNADLAAPYSKLLAFATPLEKAMFYTGHFAAILTGLALPSFSYLLGDALDGFGVGGSSVDAQYEKIRVTVIIFVIIASATWVLSYFYWSLLVIFSLRVSRRIKERYIEAILKQDCAWFDMINYTELSARISRETQAM